MKERLNIKSDEELMESYQMGNTAAFDILFERHSPKVLGYLLKRIMKKREAEDLLQEVFFKLHRSKHQYNKTLPFSPWLFSITRSVLLDQAKKRSLEDSTETDVLERMASRQATSENESPVNLSEMVEALPQVQRDVVNMRVYDEQTFEEIASRLSTSPENARQLFSRGVKKLRELLGSKGG